MSNIDYKVLSKELLKIVEDANAKYSLGDNPGAFELNLNTKEVRLKIIMSEKWIGYDLAIDEKVFGIEVGESFDTDLYPLGGKYHSITMEIFGEVTECLRGLLDRRIYVGSLNNELILAIPKSKTEYRIKRFRIKKRWWQLFDSSITSFINADAIGNIEGLRKAK